MNLNAIERTKHCTERYSAAKDTNPSIQAKKQPSLPPLLFAFQFPGALDRDGNVSLIERSLK